MEMIVVKVRLVDWKIGKCINTILPFQQHGGSCASFFLFLGKFLKKEKVPKISDFGLLLWPDSGDLDYVYSSFLQ
jgi:hypothetical protein